MKYKSIDGKEFVSRRDVRRHLRSQGLGRNIKESYIPIPENSMDDASVKTIEDYKQKMKRFA